METINNVASAASKAIWGDPTAETSNESGVEPISGETGDTSKGEPYDAGNKDSTSTESAEATPSVQLSGGDSAVSSTDTTGALPASIQQSSSAFSSDKPTSSSELSGAGSTPSASADPLSISKQQSLERQTDEPEDIKETKLDAEKVQSTDTSSHGLTTSSETGGPTGLTSIPGEGNRDGPLKSSHEEGTGEMWVKSSGMKADGGNSDASAPGGGREADQLLDDKGAHQAADISKKEEGGQSDPIESKTKKPSLGDKIKAKLHKSSHS